MSITDRGKIEIAAKVLADSFIEDPLNAELLGGLTDKYKLMAAHSLTHIKYAVGAKILNLLDGNPRAILIGIDSKNESKLREWLLVLKVYLVTFRILPFKDIKQIMSNNRKMSKVLCFRWHREFVKDRYYRLKVIAIDRSLRGSGAFRKLITPVIEYADSEGIPIVLETHNRDNVGLYQHFGFELVKTITSNETEIRQYCLIRNPAK